MKSRSNHPGFTREEYSQLLLGNARGGKKSPKLFAKYRRTTWWKERRAAYRATHRICEGCRQRPARQVHHINYRFFKERDEDLQALCGHCHMGFKR